MPRLAASLLSLILLTDLALPGAVASSAMAARIFGNPSVAAQASILARRSAAISVGCQVSPGNARAKTSTCCPVPLAISSARPSAGAWARSNAVIGPALRNADGAESRASPPGSATEASSAGRCRCGMKVPPVDCSG